MRILAVLLFATGVTLSGWSNWRVAEIAPWFGPGLYGNGTACGQTLTRKLVGIAHRKWPCGTKVKVRYRGIVVKTKVVDRGPYPPQHLRDEMPIDLTARLNCWLLNPKDPGHYQKDCPTRHNVRYRRFRP
jgi:hypothetical protein